MGKQMVKQAKYDGVGQPSYQSSFFPCFLQASVFPLLGSHALFS